MSQHPLVIGIAGGTGSGKTTIACTLAESLGPWVALLDHDAYYHDQSQLPKVERDALNYDHPDTLDNDLLVQHIQTLRGGQAVDKPIYNFADHTRAEQTVRVAPAPVIIVEGILTLALPALRNAFDVKIFVDTAADIRLMRRIRRDIEQRGRSFASVREQYYRTVRPMHLAFVEPSKQYADLIVPEGGQNHIAVDWLLGHLKHFLNENGKTPEQHLPVRLDDHKYPAEMTT